MLSYYKGKKIYNIRIKIRKYPVSFLSIFLFFSVWFKNGTYKGTLEHDKGPIVKIIRFYPNSLVVGEEFISFFKPASMMFDRTICDKPTSKIVDVV